MSLLPFPITSSTVRYSHLGDQYIKVMTDSIDEIEDDEAKDRADESLGEILRTASNISNIITPWTIQEAKVLNGLASIKELPIYVDTENSERYTLNVTEELLLGILIAIKDSKEFSICLKEMCDYYDEKGEDTPDIEVDDIIQNFSRKNNRRFSANVTTGEIFFDTIDVIRGVITGAMWLNEDPHNHITNILDNGVLVSF